MKRLRGYNSYIVERFEIIDKVDYIRDILQDLEDSGFVISMDIIKSTHTNYHREIPVRKIHYLDIIIGKEGRETFTWVEVKDSIIRLYEWYYSEYEKKLSDGTSSFFNLIRIFSGNIEFGIGWKTEDDFKIIGDSKEFRSINIRVRMD